MQNTRLNSLIAVGFSQLNRWLQNPWRRFSLILISLLFGVFLATVIATTTGQTGDIDVLVAAILILFVELSNRIVYRERRLESQLSRVRSTGLPNYQPLFVDMLNALKIGLTFGLFVEAFKIGS